nr:hypothetical protein [Tanacetum cinerariifolium]
GGVGDSLIEKKTAHVGMCAIVLTSMSVKTYNRTENSDKVRHYAIVYTVTFHCKVMIEDVRRKSGWNYPSCGGEKCRKSVSRQARKFICETCNRTVDYPVCGLPTVIRNLIGTTHVMELKPHTYYEYETYKRFTCWKINPADLVDDEASSSNQLIIVESRAIIQKISKATIHVHSIKS